MHPIFVHLRGVEADAERRALLGEFLGIGRSVPPGVIERALSDETYAVHLVMSRNNRHTLARLLGPHELAAPAAPAPSEQQQSTVSLLHKAGGALTRWMASGFATVSNEDFERRFRACEACENLVEAPDTTLYRVALARASDSRICAACGCVASRKARLATERCPSPKPDDPTMNRWGEHMGQDHPLP
jgi:hypothetical protein